MLENKQIIPQNDLLNFSNSTHVSKFRLFYQFRENQFPTIMQTLVKTYQFCWVTRWKGLKT